MSTFLEEYRRRHDINCICPVNEGMLFFNRNESPALICLISSHSKGVKVCPACPANQSGLVLEMFHIEQAPKFTRLVKHIHMNPDGDLLAYMKRHLANADEYEPVVSRGERHLERWTWEFFLATKPFRGHGSTQKLFDHMFDSKEGGQPQDAGNAWIAQATWLASKGSSLFRSYYKEIYSLCMVNRSYILSHC